MKLRELRKVFPPFTREHNRFIGLGSRRRQLSHLLCFALLSTLSLTVSALTMHVGSEPIPDWVKVEGVNYRILGDTGLSVTRVSSSYKARARDGHDFKANLAFNQRFGISSPLDGYFENHSEKHPGGFDLSILRSFVATFEVRSRELYVTDIQVRRNGDFDSVMYSSSPKDSLLSYLWPVAFKADWYSGVLVLGRASQRLLMHVRDGRVIQYVKMPESSLWALQKSQLEAGKGPAVYPSVKGRSRHENGLYSNKSEEPDMMWLFEQLGTKSKSELEKLGAHYQHYDSLEATTGGCQVASEMAPWWLSLLVILVCLRRNRVQFA